MITLISWIIVIMVVLMIVGLAVSKANKERLDSAEVNYNKYHKVNYHSTTGTGSRR